MIDEISFNEVVKKQYAPNSKSVIDLIAQTMKHYRIIFLLGMPS